MQRTSSSTVSNSAKHCLSKKKSKAGAFLSGVLGHKSSLEPEDSDNDQPVAPPKSQQPEYHAFRNCLEIEDDNYEEEEEKGRLKVLEIEDRDREEAQKTLNVEKAGIKPNLSDKSPKRSFSFSGLLNKLSFIKAIMKSTNCSRNSRSMRNMRVNSIGKAADTFATSAHLVARTQRSNGVIGRQGSSSKLPRVSSKALTAERKAKMPRSKKMPRVSSRRQIVRQKSERDREGGGGGELCKKRILMGGKCRPLSLSGILQYDKDGILLPDIIP